jgi:hypothetical protein
MHMADALISPAVDGTPWAAAGVWGLALKARSGQLAGGNR